MWPQRDLCCGEAQEGYLCRKCCAGHDKKQGAVLDLSDWYERLSKDCDEHADSVRKNYDLRERYRAKAAEESEGNDVRTVICGSKVISLDTECLRGKVDLDFSAEKDWPCAEHDSPSYQLGCLTCSILLDQGVKPKEARDGLESVPGGAGFVRPTKSTPFRRKDAYHRRMFPASAHVLNGFKATAEMLKGISAVGLGALIQEMRGHKGAIFICGNGGCASISNHLAMELSHVARRHKAVSLSSDSATLTSLANDEGVQEIFRQQLKNLSTEGDWLWCFSGSGTSANLLRAAEWAKKNGVRVFGFAGPPEDERDCHIEKVADFSIRVPSAEQQHCEIGLMFIAHTLAYAFMEE
jgi:D-sedoheptulose 7-phosphate isomerase